MPRRGGGARRSRRRTRRRRRLLVGGLVAFGAYKMSKKDADRVKQHTGTDPEELNDDELAKAMAELDIEQQKVTDADVEEGSATPPPAAAPAGVGGSEDYLEELRKLASLRDAGILTDGEFNAKKAQVLGLN